VAKSLEVTDHDEPAYKLIYLRQGGHDIRNNKSQVLEVNESGFLIKPLCLL
jgi:hypothetical protein